MVATLNQRDRSSAGGPLHVSGLFDQMRGNDPVDDARLAPDECRAGGEEKT